MKSSESLSTIAPAFVKAQQKMGAAKKTANNPHLNSTYADLSDVWSAVRGPLAENGLSILQGVSGGDKVVTVTTRLLHISGEWMEDSLSLPYVTSRGINEAQAAGSAISYARRYGLASMCCIPTEDDDGSSVGMEDAGARITDDQLGVLRDMIMATETDEAKFCQFLKVDLLENLHPSGYSSAMTALNDKAKKLAEK